MPSRGTKYSFCRPDEGAAFDGVPPVSLLDMFAVCVCVCLRGVIKVEMKCHAKERERERRRKKVATTETGTRWEEKAQGRENLCCGSEKISRKGRLAETMMEGGGERGRTWKKRTGGGARPGTGQALVCCPCRVGPDVPPR